MRAPGICTYLGVVHEGLALLRARRMLAGRGIVQALDHGLQMCKQWLGRASENE